MATRTRRWTPSRNSSASRNPSLREFRRKGELLAEICSRGIASSLDAIDSVLEMDASPTESLTELSRRFVTAVLESQKHIAIYTREEKNLAAEDARRIGEMRREFDAKLTKLLERGIAAGEFDLEDARMAALSIGGMVSWAMSGIGPRPVETGEIAERMTALITAMAAPAQSRGTVAATPRLEDQVRERSAPGRRPARLSRGNRTLDKRPK